MAWLWLNRGFAALLTVEVTLVAFARVYVGVHYPTDFIRGALLGIGLAFILCSNPKMVNSIYEKMPNSLRKSGYYLTAC